MFMYVCVCFWDKRGQNGKDENTSSFDGISAFSSDFLPIPIFHLYL